MMEFTKDKKIAQQLANAYESGDKAQVEQAWDTLLKGISQKVQNDFEELKEETDKNVLIQRGYRQLTHEEKAFYEKLIDSARSNNPKQAFADVITDANGDLMPQTIIEDVYKDLVQEHPLLAKINFVNTKYITKWLLNDHTADTAVWGKVTDAVTKEITSAFKEIDVNQHKLSAYAIVSKDMLDLGPTFLDGYIRTCLKEALACGLEKGIVKGTGKNEPIGLVKDIHKGVSVSGGVYPDKSKETVTGFTPKEYGALLGKLTKKENGALRQFTKVTLIVNQNDYLTKVMPATTVLNANGSYVNNLFPFPTEVVVSNVLADGEGVLALLPEYFFGIGGAKDGVIEYSDEFKFLEDQRVYKVKQFATGRAEDNTSALFLDISGLEPAYINVKEVASI